MNREEAIEWMVFQKEQVLAMSGDKSGTLTVAYDMAIEALQAEPKTKCVARIEVDTEEAVRRIKEEYDITDEWIPCGESLPDKEGLYMVTLKTFSDDYRFIDLLHYGKPLMPNCKVKGACWYRDDSEWGDVVYDNSDIIAWMPLPKPYREDDKV